MSQNQKHSQNLTELSKLSSPLTQRTLSLLGGRWVFNKTSRSMVSIASTCFLILASLLPYLDVFLGLFIDVNNIPTNRFPNLSTMLWSYSVCISPLLILIASKLQPYWLAYVVPFYVYITMFCGFFFLEINLEIEADWVFRIVCLILSVVVIIIGKYINDMWKIAKLKDEILDELINNHQDANKD